MNKYVFALIIIVLGLLYIAVPHNILPVCEYVSIAVENGHTASASNAGHEHSAPDSNAGHGHSAPAAPVAPPDSSNHFSPTHMVCFWTAQAEFGLGILVIFGGLLLALSKSPERRSGISLLLAGTAVFGAALPYGLIGVCRAESAACRAGTLPALLILSGLLLLFSLLNLRYRSSDSKSRQAGGNV
ncbi:MAG: DUF4418 family protein [Deltaproteobacteria bacterium]|jgi:hypothetical protein|nr:DUF4418 family protein [Deltaproteobacteria bacterium]